MGEEIASHEPGMHGMRRAQPPAAERRNWDDGGAFWLLALDIACGLREGDEP